MSVEDPYLVALSSEFEGREGEPLLLVRIRGSRSSYLFIGVPEGIRVRRVQWEVARDAGPRIVAEDRIGSSRRKINEAAWIVFLYLPWVRRRWNLQRENAKCEIRIHQKEPERRKKAYAK